MSTVFKLKDGRELVYTPPTTKQRSATKFVKEVQTGKKTALQALSENLSRMRSRNFEKMFSDPANPLQLLTVKNGPATTGRVWARPSLKVGATMETDNGEETIIQVSDGVYILKDGKNVTVKGGRGIIKAIQ